MSSSMESPRKLGAPRLPMLLLFPMLPLRRNCCCCGGDGGCGCGCGWKGSGTDVGERPEKLSGTGGPSDSVSVSRSVFSIVYVDSIATLAADADVEAPPDDVSDEGCMGGPVGGRLSPAEACSICSMSVCSGRMPHWRAMDAAVRALSPVSMRTVMPVVKMGGGAGEG